MITKLRRLRPRARAPINADRCDLCDLTIARRHDHVVNLESRALLCVCGDCHELFVRPGAAQGRFRAVPDRYEYTSAIRMSAADWTELRISGRIAFFVHESALGRTVAFHPAPSGVAEAELPPATWDRVLAAEPRLPDARPDVEALLIARGADGFDCYLVPVDECYRLVGLFRRSHPDLTGGATPATALDHYLAALRRRSAEAECGRDNDLE